MAYTKFDFTVPQLNNYFVQKGGIDYSKSHIIESHKKMIENVDKNYGKIIDKWADVFQIDRGILICFICTESGGKNAPRNRFDATGLTGVLSFFSSALKSGLVIVYGVATGRPNPRAETALDGGAAGGVTPTLPETAVTLLLIA